MGANAEQPLKIQFVLVTRFGPVIGRFMDKPIPDWIAISNGQILPFDGIVIGNEPETAVIISPGLVFGRHQGCKQPQFAHHAL